jgi:hypothetical protein
LPDASLLNHSFSSGWLGSWASAGVQSSRKIRIIRIITVDRLASGSAKARPRPIGDFWLGAGHDRAGHVIAGKPTRDNIAPELTPVPATFSCANLMAGWGSDMPVRTGEILKVGPFKAPRALTAMDLGR